MLSKQCCCNCWCEQNKYTEGSIFKVHQAIISNGFSLSTYLQKETFFCSLIEQMLRGSGLPDSSVVK